MDWPEFNGVQYASLTFESLVLTFRRFLDSQVSLAPTQGKESALADTVDDT